MANSYVDLGLLKDVYVGMNIGVTTSDVELLRLAESASRFIDNYCSRVFYTYKATKYYDGVRSRSRNYSEWDRYPETNGGLISGTDGWKLYLRKGEDLLSVDSITISQDNDRIYDTTLSAATDYYLWPDNETAKNRIDLDTRNGQLSSWGYGRQRIKVTGTWGFSNTTEGVASILDGTLTPTATVMAVVSGAAYEVGWTILVESEQMYITGITSNNLTVQRGVNGTTAAAHADDTTVSRYIYDPRVVQATYIQVSRWWKRRGDGFASSTSNPSTGVINIWKGLDPDIEELLKDLGADEL